jgi:hypothetical protein
VAGQLTSKFIEAHQIGYYIHIELLWNEKSVESTKVKNAAWAVNFGLVDWFSADGQHSAYRPIYRHPSTGAEIRYDDLIVKHRDVAEQVLHKHKFAKLRAGPKVSKWGEYRVLKATLHSWGPCK